VWVNRRQRKCLQATVKFGFTSITAAGRLQCAAHKRWLIGSTSGRWKWRLLSTERTWYLRSNMFSSPVCLSVCHIHAYSWQSTRHIRRSYKSPKKHLEIGGAKFLPFKVLSQQCEFAVVTFYSLIRRHLSLISQSDILCFTVPSVFFSSFDVTIQQLLDGFLPNLHQWTSFRY